MPVFLVRTREYQYFYISLETSTPLNLWAREKQHAFTLISI